MRPFDVLFGGVQVILIHVQCVGGGEDQEAVHVVELSILHFFGKRCILL